MTQLKTPLYNEQVEYRTPESFLKSKYYSEKYHKIDIKHLWGKCYRVNFWVVKEHSRTDCAFGNYSIVKSIFVRLDNVNNEWEVKEEYEN